MSAGYYCEDHPNPRFAQYGWPRRKASGVIGVHTTESGVYLDGPDPGAENTAGYIGRRADPGSYHIMADWDTIIRLVRPTFAAWADVTNNAHALSVSGAMNAARWRDLSPARAAAIVRNMGKAAALLAQDAVAHGVLDQVPPARRITAQEAIAGTKAGFYGHGETNPGTRYDPGTNFDWDLFLASYAAAVGGGINYQGTIITPLEEDELSASELLEWPIERTDGQKSRVIDELAKMGPDNQKLLAAVGELFEFVRGVNQKVDRLETDVDELQGNAAKTFWNSEESKILLQNQPATELAAQLDAAGVGKAVLDALLERLEASK